MVFHPRVPPAPQKWPALLLFFAAGFLFSVHAANALNTIKCGTKRYVCMCANNPAPSSLYTNISCFRSLSLSLYINVNEKTVHKMQTNTHIYKYRHTYYVHTVGGRNPAPLYLHPKTNLRTPSLTLGHCLVVRKKEVE